MPDEVEAVLKVLQAAGYVGVRTAVALAYCAGLRKQDIAVENGARAKEQVEFDPQSKTTVR